MTLATGPNIGQLVNGAPGESHYSALMKQWRALDWFAQPHVKDKDLTSAPGSVADGDAYIMATAWSGVPGAVAGGIARWSSVQSAWEIYTPRKGWVVRVDDEVDAGGACKRYGYSGTAWLEEASGSGGVYTHSIIVACSDEVTALSAGVAKVTFRMPYAFTLQGVRASLTTPQASGLLFTVDIKEAGTSILSTKLTLDNTEKTSTTAATPPVISDSSLADDAEMTVDITQVGDGSAKGLKVALIGFKTP